MWRKIIFVFTIIKSTHLIINVCRIWELTKYAMLLLLLLLLLDSLNAVINCFLGTKGFCKSKARVIWGRGCFTNPVAKKHREKTPITLLFLFWLKQIHCPIIFIKQGLLSAQCWRWKAVDLYSCMWTTISSEWYS